MKIGDLVKMLDDHEVRRSHPHHDFNAVGIIKEWTCHGSEGPLASCTVLWSGSNIEDVEFAEDLVLIT